MLTLGKKKMFIIIDSTNGRVTEMFTDELAPAGSVEVSDEQYAAILDFWPDVAFVGGEVKELDYASYVTFDIARDRKMFEINTLYENSFAMTKIDTPPSEADTWTKQENEARKWLADNTQPTPLIDKLAAFRGVEKEWLIEKVIAKADAYVEFIGIITGMRQKYEDMVKAATTIEEINAIAPTYDLGDLS